MSSKDVIKRLEDQKLYLRLEYESKIEGINYALSLLRDQTPENNELSHTYIAGKGIDPKPRHRVTSNPDYTRSKIKDRIMDFISSSKRFVHNREITDAIYDERYGFDSSKQFSRYLSTALWMLKKKGKLTKIRHDDSPKNMFWGLPEWIEHGKVMPDYGYNKQLLT